MNALNFTCHSSISSRYSVQFCERYLAVDKIINVYNACALLTHAHACRADQLERTLMSQMRQMIEVISKLPEWEDLPSDLKEKVLAV